MTTENFDLKKDDVIVGETGLGSNIGYYIKTTTDKKNIWVHYSTSKDISRGVYVEKLENVRAVTKEEIAKFLN